MTNILEQSKQKVKGQGHVVSVSICTVGVYNSKAKWRRRFTLNHRSHLYLSRDSTTRIKCTNSCPIKQIKHNTSKNCK